MKFQIRQNYGLLILSLFWKCQKGQESKQTFWRRSYKINEYTEVKSHYLRVIHKLRPIMSDGV